MNIPCEQCLLIPICRHKIYAELMTCDLLSNVVYSTKVDNNHVFTFESENYYEALIKAKETLRATKWEVAKRDYGKVESNVIINHFRCEDFI